MCLPHCGAVEKIIDMTEFIVREGLVSACNGMYKGNFLRGVFSERSINSQPIFTTSTLCPA
ncbi:hypothetical protein M2403_002349 [Rahnella sp. BIGb0603]|nr:hypothetical protein [Rahnella sp. BIGb0603]